MTDDLILGTLCVSGAVAATFVGWFLADIVKSAFRWMRRIK